MYIPSTNNAGSRPATTFTDLVEDVAFVIYLLRSKFTVLFCVNRLVSASIGVETLLSFSGIAVL